jgi:hypothetical protein
MAKKFKTKGVIPRKFGYKGLNVETSGWPTDLEVIADLTPPDGLSRFYVMQTNDPIVGGIMWHIRSIFNRCRLKWNGDVPDAVRNHLTSDFWSVIMADLCSTLTYGFYVGELLWDIVDGLPMLVDIEPRYQTTIYKFMDDYIEQICPDASVDIPRSKVLHVTVGSEARSPYGTSFLRAAYKSYYMKTHIEASESNSLDRDLAGLPVMTAPEGFDFMRADSTSDAYDENVGATLEWAIDVVRNIRKDSQQGVVMPNGWELRLLRAEGDARDTEAPIRRHNESICVAILEGFLANVVSSKGRSADSEYHLAVLTMGVNEIAKSFVHEINKQVVAKLQDIYGFSGNLAMESLTNYNLKDLASYIGRLIAQGAITPTYKLQEALLGIVDLPFDEKEVKSANISTHGKD